MDERKAVELSAFVPQRGINDCVIATLATCTGMDYDTVADGLGIAVNKDSGKREVGEGIDGFGTIYPLMQMGWAALPLCSREMKKDPDKCIPPLLDQAQLRFVLANEKAALIGYVDDNPEVGSHSLAWDGSRAIDCIDGTEVPLAKIREIHSVTVLRRIV
jgi:hypothetical protein